MLSHKQKRDINILSGGRDTVIYNMCLSEDIVQSVYGLLGFCFDLFMYLFILKEHFRRIKVGLRSISCGLIFFSALPFPL